MPKLFVLLILAILALPSMAFVHVHYIPHHVSRPVHMHRATAPIRHARTVVHPRPVHVYHHPRPVYGPVVYDHVYFHVNPFWIPLLLSSHTTRTVIESQSVVVQQIVQQVPEYNQNGPLLIQTNSVSGASN